MESEQYRTADMALAAFLILEGYAYRGVSMANGDGPPRAEALFENEGDLDVAVRDYELGDAGVEPRDFQRKVAFVRNRMRDCMREHGHLDS